jgi:integrase/recombinase XerD
VVTVHQITGKLAQLPRNDRGTIMVRQGKGQKDRMVPIGERAIAWIERYINEVRPILEAGDSEGNTPFLTDGGKPSRRTK